MRKLAPLLAVIPILFSAAEAQGAGLVECRASAIRIVNKGQVNEPVVANAAHGPCLPSQNALASVPFTGLRSDSGDFQALEAQTSAECCHGPLGVRWAVASVGRYREWSAPYPGPGPGGYATGWASISLGYCRNGQAWLNGHSRAFVSAGVGDGGNPHTHVIPGVGTLYVNERIRNGRSLTVRAARLVMQKTELVVAEVKATAPAGCPDA